MENHGTSQSINLINGGRSTQLGSGKTRIFCVFSGYFSACGNGVCEVKKPTRWGLVEGGREVTYKG